MIKQYPLIPDAAFLYFPEREMIIITVKDKIQRYIFDGGVEYEHFENQKIRQFIKYINHQDQNVQILQTFSKPVLLRHLQATSFNFKEASKALLKLYEWEQTVTPLNMTYQVSQLLKTGVLYHCGRDCHFRPIFVINVGKIVNMNVKQKQMIDLLGFFFQFAIQNLLIQGQVENWNTIIDLGNASVFSLGGALIDTITFLSSMFRCRVNHSFLVNCPSSIKWVWGMVKKVLNQDQIKKISMTNKSVLEHHAFEFINHSQIQQKYGGTMSQIKQFWPMKVNSSYLFEAKKQIKIISTEQYSKMFDENKLINKKINEKLIIKCENEDSLVKLESSIKKKSSIMKKRQSLFQQSRLTSPSKIYQEFLIPIEQKVPQIPDFPPPLMFIS